MASSRAAASRSGAPPSSPTACPRGRTARDRNRPLLRTANPEATLRALLEARDPLYREIADLVVETDERPPRMVVLDILERLQKLPPR